MIGEIKKTEWRYGVRCVGIKKRARNRNRHSETDLFRTDGELFDERMAEVRAREWLEKNMKTFERVEVFACRFHIGEGMEEWRPFDEEDNKSWALQ
jgi:hypothetical protein